MTKKADIYFIGKDKEIRISVDISEEKTFVDAFNKVAEICNSHHMQPELGVKLQSIYFSEEIIK